MAKVGIKKQIARFTRRLRDPDAFRLAAPAATLARTGPVAAHMAAVEAELSRLSRGWNQHIPQILDAVGIALEEARSANQIHDRFDALRLDMDRLTERVDLNLADLKSPLPSCRAAPQVQALVQVQVQVQVVNPDRLSTSIATDLKLHFLRSDPPLPGFVNISEKAAAGVDVIAAPDAPLPVPQGRAIEIEVASGYGVSRSRASWQLGYWLMLLAPGGQLRIQRLDLGAALDAVAAGSLRPHKMAAILAAADGTISSDAVTPQALLNLAKAGGFTAVRLTRDKSGMATLRAVRPETADS